MPLPLPLPLPSLTLAVLIFGLALPVAAAKAAELRVIAGGSITGLKMFERLGIATPAAQAAIKAGGMNPG